MSKKYNLLPGASHFQPFFSGENIHLHFSYTDTTMYCKEEVVVNDSSVSFVEARLLEGELKAALDAMASDDYIGPMRIFGDLSGDHNACHQLDGFLSNHRLLTATAADLCERLEDLDTESEEHGDLDALLGFNSDESYEAVTKIKKIMDSFNQISGYDPKSKTIPMKRQ